MTDEWRLTQEQGGIVEECRAFAASEITPHLTHLEEDIAFRLHLFSRMATLGLFTLSLSESIGTLGYLFALKEIAKADAGIGVGMAVTNMVAEAISTYGTKAQQDKYLQMINHGVGIPFSFAMTEKQAGSDVKAIETQVIEDPEDQAYILLTGEKQFITNGDIAGAMIVIAKDERLEPPGISAFLVDQGTPGLTVTKKESKLGLLTANLVSLRFEKCRLTNESLLGELGDGLKIALSSLDNGRLGIAAQALGIAEAAFEAAVVFSKKRHQFWHPISDNQANSLKLADMHVKLSASIGLIRRAVELKTDAACHTLAAAEAKLYCSEVCNEIASEALQIHGGYGYIKDYLVEKYFRDARVTTLYEGTSEIQRLIISRDLLSHDETIKRS